MLPISFSSSPRPRGGATPVPHRGWTLRVTPLDGAWAGAATRAGRDGARRVLPRESGLDRAAVLAALRARIDARHAGFVAARKLAEPVDVASAEEFLDALDFVDPKGARLRMLVRHASAPGRELSAAEIGRVGGYDGVWGANMHYGKLARDIAEAMDLRPEPELLASHQAAWTMVIAEDAGRRDAEGGFVWRMHAPLAEALRRLGLIAG